MDAEELQRELEQVKLELETKTESIGELEQKLSSVESQFETFGGADQAHKQLDFLMSDPGFDEYFKSKMDPKAEDKTNSNPQEEEAIQKVRDISIETMAPMQKSLSKIRLDEVVKGVATKYPGWEQYTKEINTLQEVFPFKNRNDPTPNEMEALFLMAAKNTDGDSGIEVLINEPPAEPEDEFTIPKDLTAEDALVLAKQHTAQRR